MSLFIWTVVFVIVYFVLTSNRITSAILTNMRHEINYFGMATMSTIADIINRRKNRLGDVPKRTGEVAIVTGGARGIGEYVSRGLVKSGYHVILGVRNVQAGKALVADIKSEVPSASADVIQLDVSSMESVRRFADVVKSKHPKVHLLVNNAGIIYGDFHLTQDGFESQLATNYVGHFLLTHLMMDRLEKGWESGRCARIVNVASCAHYGAEIQFDDINLERSYNSTDAYARSKLAQLMFTRHLNRLLLAADAPVRAYAAHPGIVASDMMTKCPQTQLAGKLKILFKTPEEGARPVLHCCFSSELEQPGGNYISNCEEGYSTAYSKNEEKQKKLFDVTCDMLNIKRFGVQ
ncbi:polyprenol dehydrogenase-like isoform X1 [Arctopsyche grandis]|uniref:polyprenol dehydrogenase-like isoform X1 n=1 Tax=Arctopsyche grandis TaxID=121162 RepID=UPI00406D8A02